MVVTYGDAILRAFVAQICRDIGWNASHVTSLEVLTQITSQYMRQLAKQCVQYANHCGRQTPTLDDIGLAFTQFNVDLNELKDYVLSVESTPLELPVPKFPVSNVSNRAITNTGEGEDRPECYYEWMPPLRESRTVGSADESGETSKATEDALQDSLMSPTSTSHLAQELGSSSPKRSTPAVDSFGGLLRDLYTASVGQREGRLPDSQRNIESEPSRENSPEREEKIEEKPKIEEKEKKDKKEKKKDKKELREEMKLKRRMNKESLGLKTIISKDKIKDKKKMKKFLKIKDLSKRSYSPLSIKVVGLSTGTPTATSTPTMARSPASVTSPDGLKNTNASFDSSIDAVIDRICSKEEMKSSTKADVEMPKKKAKLKRDESVEKRPKKSKKNNAILEASMNESIDEVVRQSQTALLSPHKRSPHPQSQPLHPNTSPKVKSETLLISSPNSRLNAQAFDDDEAAKTLVLMAGEKNVPKRKKNKPSATATSATSASPVHTNANSANSANSNNDSNSSAFQSAMSSFPKVSPGVSPLSPTMFSMSNQNPFFPTPPLFGYMSPPLLTPMQTSPHESYPLPPPLTKPKTLAEKKALPPEIMNAPVVKKEKDKENKTDRKERDRERDRDKEKKKAQKLKTKKTIKSRKTISDDSSSEEEIKPKINIKLGSTAKSHPNPSDKLAVKTSAEMKSPDRVKTLLSPKHNVQNAEELSSKKKRGPKKKPMKEVVKEDKSCIVIRETITVETTGEGDGKVWICPACKGPDDGSPMIGCDTCDEWYHLPCVGIKEPPGEHESWFCKKCIQKQQQIESKFVKKKEIKKRVKDK